MFAADDPVLWRSNHFSLKIGSFDGGFREIREFRLDRGPFRRVQFPGGRGGRGERSGGGCEAEFGNFDFSSRAVGGVEAELSNQAALEPACGIGKVLLRHGDGMPLAVRLKRRERPSLAVGKSLLVVRVIELAARRSGAFRPVTVDERPVWRGIERDSGKNQLRVLADSGQHQGGGGGFALDVFPGFPAGKLVAAVPHRRLGGGNGQRECEKKDHGVFHEVFLFVLFCCKKASRQIGIRECRITKGHH